MPGSSGDKSSESLERAPNLFECSIPGCSSASGTTAQGQWTAGHQEHKICAYHSKLPALVLAGRMVRYCSGCNKLQGLQDFEGDRRDCREALCRQKELRHRRKGKMPYGGHSQQGSCGSLGVLQDAATPTMSCGLLGAGKAAGAAPGGARADDAGMDLAEAAQQWVINELMEDTDLQDLLACCAVPCSLTSPALPSEALERPGGLTSLSWVGQGCCSPAQLGALPADQAAQPMHLDQQEVGVGLVTAVPTLPAGPPTPAVAKAGLSAGAKTGELWASDYQIIQSAEDTLAAAEAAPKVAGCMMPSAASGPGSDAAQTTAQAQEHMVSVRIKLCNVLPEMLPEELQQTLQQEVLATIRQGMQW